MGDDNSCLRALEAGMAWVSSALDLQPVVQERIRTHVRCPSLGNWCALNLKGGDAIAMTKAGQHKCSQRSLMQGAMPTCLAVRAKGYSLETVTEVESHRYEHLPLVPLPTLEAPWAFPASSPCMHVAQPHAQSTPPTYPAAY